MMGATASFCHWEDAPVFTGTDSIERRQMTPEQSLHAFREAVGSLSGQWLATGLPSRQGLDEAALELERLRERLAVQGIWEHPPAMVTATLDDGLGQGLAIIETFAGVIGIRLISLGLMQTPEAVIHTCLRDRPDFLGLTILHFDTEDDLTAIAKHLPTETRIVAGGPAFKGDPDFAGRTGTHFVANNVADFMRFMLDSA
jgi:methylmalonyl-CoA mutase cobalamin-binding subunit